MRFFKTLNGKLLIFSILFNILYISMGLNLFEADSTTHMLRFLGLAQSFDNYDFFPSLNYTALNGLNYIMPIFYNNWYFYPFLLFYFLGVPLIVIKVLIMVVVNFITVFAISKLLKKLTANEHMNFFLTFLYFTNPYRLHIMISSYRLPELIAQIIIPFVFYYFLEILNNQKERKNYVLLIIYLNLLLITHNISFFLTVVSLIILFIVSFKKWNFELIKNFVISGVVFLIISSWYTAPIIEQINFSDLYMSKLSLLSLSGYFERMPLLNSVLSTIFQVPMYESLSFIFLLFSIILFFQKNKFIEIKILFFLFLLFIILANTGLLDETLLNNVQFYTRIFSIIPAILIIIVPKYDSKVLNGVFKYRKIIIIFTSMLIIIFTGIKLYASRDSHLSYEVYDNQYLFNEQIGGGLEYVPYTDFASSHLIGKDLIEFSYANSNQSPIMKINREIEFVGENPLDYSYLNTYNKYSLYINNDKTPLNIIIPKLYYKGYQVKVNDEEVPYEESKYGTIELNLDNIEQATITVRYVGTKMQLFFEMISGISLILFLIYFYKVFKKD